MTDEEMALEAARDAKAMAYRAAEAARGTPAGEAAKAAYGTACAVYEYALNAAYDKAFAAYDKAGQKGTDDDR